MKLTKLLLETTYNELVQGRDVVLPDVPQNQITAIKDAYFERRVDVTANITPLDEQATAIQTTYSIKIYARERRPEGGHKA